MKLAFIFDTRFTEFNGDFYSTNFTKEFWENRYLKVFDDIVVIGRYVSVPNNPSGKLVKSNSEKVKFCCIPDENVLKRIFTQKRQNDFIKQHINGCDRVICRSWWGTKACRYMNVPYMLEVVNCMFDSYWNHSFLGKMVALPNFILQRNAVRKAPYVLYVTKSFLQKRYPSNHQTISVSDVELKSESEEMANSILQNRIELINKNTDDFLVIGTAGNVGVRYKGQQFVIRALAELKRRGVKNIKYQLAGGGDYSYLESVARECGVENQVQFMGAIPHSEIFNWYDSLNIYIQPSLTEGLPRAVVEAMSRALPCIGSNVGGIPELIEQRYLFNSKECHPENQIAELIEHISKENLIEMATSSITKVKSFNTELLNKRRIEFMVDFCGEIVKDKV